MPSLDSPNEPRTPIVPWPVACLLILSACVAFSPARTGGFLYDDIPQIARNPDIKSETGLYTFWCTTHQPDYWPISFSSFWFLWRLFPDQPQGFRWVNILVHGMSAIVLARIYCQMKAPRPFVLAWLFAIHPVAVEAVAWVVQLKTLLSSLFAFAALSIWLEGEERNQPILFVPAAIAFAMSLLAKTTALFFPFIVASFLFANGRLLRPRSLAFLITLLCVSFSAGVIGLWFQKNRGIADIVIRDDNMLSRCCLAGKVFWFYLGKLAWPTDLSFVYPRWQTGMNSMIDLLPSLLAAGILMGSLIVRRVSRPRLWSAGIQSYFWAIFPVLGFFDIFYMRYSFVADHWQYFAMGPGIGCLFGPVFFLIDRIPSLNFRRLLNVVMTCALGVFFFGLTWQRATLFGDPTQTKLWTKTVAENPSATMPRMNLAFVYASSGKLDDAIALAEKVLKEEPNNPELLFDLAQYHTQKRDFDQAIILCRRSLNLQPNFYQCHYLLVQLLASVGRKAEAAVEQQRLEKQFPGMTAPSTSASLAPSK